MKFLALEDTVDALNCMKALGYSMDKETEIFDLNEREPEEKWSSTVKKFRQGNLAKLDEYTQDKLKR